MQNPLQSLVSAGEAYQRHLDQFNNFKTRLSEAISSSDVPSLKLLESNDPSEIPIAFMGCDFRFRYRLLHTARIIEPGCQFLGGIDCENLSSKKGPVEIQVDRDGNASVYHNGRGNVLGSLETDLEAVFIKIMNSLIS